MSGSIASPIVVAPAHRRADGDRAHDEYRRRFRRTGRESQLKLIAASARQATMYGGLLPLWVCRRPWLELRSDYAEPTIAGAGQAGVASTGGNLSALRPAVVQIVIADVAREHPVPMVFGLALSAGFVIFAASLIAKLLEGHPWVAYLGVAPTPSVAVVMVREGRTS